MKLKIIFACALVTMMSCSEDDLFPLENRCGAPGVAAYENHSYSLFDNTEGNLSSGEINSYVDWGEKRIWLVSNGTYNSPEGIQTLRNCLIVESNSSAEVIYTRDDETPKSFLPEPDDEHFYTLNQGVIYNGRLELIVSKWKLTGTGRTSEHVASMTVAFSLDNWQLLEQKEIDVSKEIMIGSALLVHHSYTYVYATKNVFWNKEALVARVSGSLFAPWEYYDGYLWQPSAHAMKPVLSDVSDFFSVFVEGDNVFALSHGALLAPEIKLHRAHLPEDGWQFKKILYCENEASGDPYATNAIVVSYTKEKLVCSYSRIDADFGKLENTVPRFLDLGNWNY